MVLGDTETLPQASNLPAVATQGDLLFYNGSNWVVIAATAAQGVVPYYNGTIWTFLTPGTAGQFLKTQGAGANPIWASVPESDMIKMHSHSGSSANAGDVEGSTFTFNSSDFTAGDLCLSIIQMTSTTASGIIYVRCSDGTNTFDYSALVPGTEGAHIIWIHQSNENTAHGKLVGTLLNYNANTNTVMRGSSDAMNANWITSAWTISLRVQAQGGGTVYWRWKVYKVVA